MSKVINTDFSIWVVPQCCDRGKLMGNTRTNSNSAHGELEARNRIAGMIPTSNWKAIGEKSNSLPWGRWTHQYDAFDFVIKYLKHTATTQAPKSALIRMPTGTGKTGVMALTAGYATKPVAGKIILIVVPSRALRIQVREALDWRYWSVVGNRPKFWRPVREFTPGTLGSALGESNDTWPGDPLEPVLVCTTTTISMLSGDSAQTESAYASLEQENDIDDAKENVGLKDYKIVYRSLLDRTGLVLIDEGHREPAPAWARAIRRFNCPRILFSATPYRNDLRLFDIGRIEDRKKKPSSSNSPGKPGRAFSDGPYRFALPLQVATENLVIREVSFRHPSPNVSWSDSQEGKSLTLTARARNFAKAISKLRASEDVKKIEDWGAQQKQTDGALPLSPPKIIVRCATVEAIRAVKSALQKEQKNTGSVIAVHTRFSPPDAKNGLYDQVPDLDSHVAQNANFWVHQDMLIEGLDHPGFWIVAIFDAFGNERSLIQQIGRILRKPTNSESPHAIVFSDRDQNIEDSWKRYTQYEAECPSIVGPEEIVERFIRSLPHHFYSNGRFRPTIDLFREDNQDEIWAELKVAARAQILQREMSTAAPNEPEIEEFIQDVSDRLELSNYTTVQVLHPPSSSSVEMRALITLRVSESSHIDPSNFFDIKIGPAVLVLTEKFLFWQGPVEISHCARHYGFTPIPSVVLRTLLGKNSLVKQTSTLNTDLNTAAIRRRSMGAVDLQLSGVTLGDEGHAIVSAYASSGSVRRNLNFERGRVNEAFTGLLSLDKYASWAKSIAAELGKDMSSYPAMLNRYATEVSAPDDAAAAHVLIDPRLFSEHFTYSVSDTQDSSETDDSPPFGALLEATATSLDPDQKEFEANIGPVRTKFRITYKRGRFDDGPMDKNKLLSSFTKRDESTTNWNPETLLTSKVSIQVVTTNGLMYTNGRFYEPRRLWGPDSISRLPAIHGIKALGDVKLGEKGFKGKELQTRKIRNKTTWHSSSLFGMIDKRNHEIFRVTSFIPRWLVCDDMGSEYADFIALDDSSDSLPRLVMIHCKMGSSTSEKSTAAGDLHVVISQALKNLGLFSDNTGMLDDRGKKWDGVFDKNANLPLIRRSVGSNVKGSDFVSRLKEALRSPDVRREIWLVMGNSVSAEETKNASKSTSRPKPHKIHLLYLLQSMKSSANSLGIQLRLITKP